uniref:Uncharacterized protein n=1 Tax=Micrurus surinamensis TaxID=129470 RepID=A0A2D4P928_MICSU
MVLLLCAALVGVFVALLGLVRRERHLQILSDLNRIFIPYFAQSSLRNTSARQAEKKVGDIVSLSCTPHSLLISTLKSLRKISDSCAMYGYVHFSHIQQLNIYFKISAAFQ